MKILITAMYDMSASGGQSTFVSSLTQGYKAAGHSVELIDERSVSGWKRFLAFWFIRNPLFIVRQEWGMLAYFAIMERLLREKIQNANADIIHAQDPVAMLASEGNNTVFTVHGDLTNMCLSDGVLKKNSRGEARALEIERHAYTLANTVVAVDTRLQQHVLQFVDRQVHIIKNFVDTTRFSPANEHKRAQLRKQHDLTGFTIFCPRRLVPKNGVIFAAQAMKKVNATLVVAGNGPQRTQIEKLKQKNIVLLGDIPHANILSYYQACDAVVIPSVTSEGVIEATSIAALEAMACERPVVASAIGGLAELITDRRTGLLVGEQRSEELARAFNKLIQDQKLVKRLGKTAREFVIKNNSLKSQTKRYLSLLQKVFTHNI